MRLPHSIFSHHVYVGAASDGGLLEKSIMILLLQYMNPCDPVSESPNSIPLGCCLLIPTSGELIIRKSESVLVPYASQPGWALPGMGGTSGSRDEQAQDREGL